MKQELRDLSTRLEMLEHRFNDEITLTWRENEIPLEELDIPADRFYTLLGRIKIIEYCLESLEKYLDIEKFQEVENPGYIYIKKKGDK